MIRALYSLMVMAAQPFLRRKLRRRGAAEPGYLHAIEERFGRYRGTAEPGALWIHAVSLGETRAAAILLDRLRQRASRPAGAASPMARRRAGPKASGCCAAATTRLGCRGTRRRRCAAFSRISSPAPVC